MSTMNSGGDGSDDGSNRKRKVGYGYPPLSGRIKPGEVRNPYGRNGKRKEEEIEPFEKVRRRLSRVTIDGKASLVPNEESFWLRQWSKALNGDNAASRLIEKKLSAIQKLGPPPPTAEELARREVEQADRERMAKRLTNLLEEKAEEKRDGPDVQYGLDGKPIANEPDDDSAPREAEEPTP